MNVIPTLRIDTVAVVTSLRIPEILIGTTPTLDSLSIIANAEFLGAANRLTVRTVLSGVDQTRKLKTSPTPQSQFSQTPV